MRATAKLKYLRIAPRKVRLLADLVRGKKVEEARRLLQFAAKHSGVPVLKTLNSAVASAKNNFQADESNLYISHIAVNEGPKLKRYRARARGQAYEIQKKSSHLTIKVDEIEHNKHKAKRAAAPRSPQIEKLQGRKTASRPSFRPERDIQPVPKHQGIAQRIFQRKSI